MNSLASYMLAMNY